MPYDGHIAIRTTSFIPNVATRLTPVVLGSAACRGGSSGGGNNRITYDVYKGRDENEDEREKKIK